MFKKEKSDGRKTPTLMPFLGRTYALNLDKLKEICMTPLQGNQKEQEIVQTYEADDAGDFTISQKIERETRNNANQQNDMFLYDFV